jgi:hypothetical protein
MRRKRGQQQPFLFPWEERRKGGWGGMDEYIWNRKCFSCWFFKGRKKMKRRKRRRKRRRSRRRKRKKKKRKKKKRKRNKK